MKKKIFVLTILGIVAVNVSFCRVVSQQREVFVSNAIPAVATNPVYIGATSGEVKTTYKRFLFIPIWSIEEDTDGIHRVKETAISGVNLDDARNLAVYRALKKASDADILAGALFTENCKTQQLFIYASKECTVKVNGHAARINGADSKIQ